MKKLKLLQDIARQYFNRLWRNYSIQKGLVIMLFVLGVILIWCLFIESDIIDKTNERITFLIGSFGILFTIVQYFMNSISKKLSFIKRLRYEEYVKLKELIDLFNKHVIEDLGAINTSLNLQKKLHNTYLDFKSRLEASNKYVFPHVLKNKATMNIEQILLFILHENTGFDINKNILLNGKNLDEILNGPQEKKEEIRIALSPLTLDWIKKISIELERLNKEKILFYEYLQKFIF